LPWSNDGAGSGMLGGPVGVAFIIGSWDTAGSIGVVCAVL